MAATCCGPAVSLRKRAPPRNRRRPRRSTPLVLAGPVQPGQEDYFQTEIEPHVDGRCVRYVGETGGERKRRLFADARGLLMPIRWDEPFGMVMVEALACGTPVIAFPEGAAVEIVQDGLNGYLVDDEDAMAAAVARLARIKRPDCRTSVQERFDLDMIAAQYETIYQRAAATVTISKFRPLSCRLTIPRSRRSSPTGAHPATARSVSRSSICVPVAPIGAAGTRRSHQAAVLCRLDRPGGMELPARRYGADR